MNNIIKTALVSAAIAAASVATPATAATTIDFNTASNGKYFVPSVTSNGFLATENLNENGATPLGTNISVDSQGPSNGTVHLDSWTNNGADSIWTLTKVGGGAFSLNSFDFASAAYNVYSAASLVTITGTTAANATVSQIFAPVAGGFQTFTVLPTFANVTSVRFDAFGNLNRSAYDNIVVDAAGAVPEPASWAMMILGLGAVGFAMRRRQNVRTTVSYA